MTNPIHTNLFTQTTIISEDKNSTDCSGDKKAHEIMTQMFQLDDTFYTPPTTPRSSKMGDFSPVPPTPAKHSPLPENYEPFKTPIPLSEEGSFSLNLIGKVLKFIKIGGYYSVSTGEKVCIKQPEQNKSCGVGVLFMLMNDHKIQILESKQEGFAKWSLHSQLLNNDELVKSANDMTNVYSMGLEFKTKTLKEYRFTDKVSFDFNSEAADSSKFSSLISILKGLIEESKSSIIIDITHDKLSGHWIILDEIQEGRVFIRDPYKGKAYCLSYDELFQNILKSDLKLVYVDKSSN
ncbi:hypothetical protein [Candidatus Neptunichlamydia sp. REUL1]|uniref:hypothetical protein n=1 Tax=Candidatus Neptunichlamydia sp. REUL1 TaxID=3064277 RepID=UPI0029305BD0|nr:hypothetical protein [Candidatus Neptunochlamydia sp. REUL1]